MRLTEPRILPITEPSADGDAREILEQLGREGRVLNIYRSLAVHPKLLKRWAVFGTHVLYKNTLPARERELLILRTGWRCRSEYEWGQHVIIAKASGLSGDEIARVKKGPDAAGWSDSDAALLRAADELHDDAFITDDTWAALAERFNPQQLIDLVFTVGQYHTVSMALNTLGVQLDEGVRGFDG